MILPVLFNASITCDSTSGGWLKEHYESKLTNGFQAVDVTSVPTVAEIEADLARKYEAKARADLGVPANVTCKSSAVLDPAWIKQYQQLGAKLRGARQ